jgi:hypothetical protein
MCLLVARIFEDVKRSTRIIYDPTDLTRENNVYNIDYIPSGATNAKERVSHCFFSNSIISELQLRRLPVYGGFKDRRE